MAARDGGKWRPGRKPTFDRENALDMARDLFWRSGYDGVSLVDLTQAIGVAAPSLYHAFGSKADLFREIVERYAGDGVTPESILAAPTAREALELMLASGIAAVTRDDPPPGCLISSGMLMTSEQNLPLAQVLRDHRTRNREALRAKIEEDIAAGKLPEDVDADATARFFTSVNQGMSVQAIDGAVASDLHEVATLAMRRFPE